MGDVDIMLNELRIKHDDKFLAFVRKWYRIAPGDYIEDYAKKMIVALTSRINLLLPDYYLIAGEHIVRCDGYSAYGSWKVEVPNSSDYSKSSDEYLNITSEELCRRRNEAFEKWKELETQHKKMQAELNSYKNNNKRWEHDRLAPKESAIYNQCKAEKAKYEKYNKAMFDLRERDSLFETFTETEQQLYELLLNSINFQTNAGREKNGYEIKKGNWNTVDLEKREKIYNLFSKAVKESPVKWILSNEDMLIVRAKMLDRELYDFLTLKNRLLNVGMPVDWIEIIEENKETRITNLKKMESLLKRTGIIGNNPVLTEESLMAMIEKNMHSEQ